MKIALVLCACLILAACIGCSCVSTVERVNRIPAVNREDYVKLHPECDHRNSIVNGEIIPGMSANEVMASWGFPNVYVVTRTSPTEEWIYYLKDRDSLTMLIYTLTFADDTLQVWDIDQKRFVGQGVISSDNKKHIVPIATVQDMRRR